MNAFPLLRTRWSNERLMTLLLAVLTAYLLPRFFSDPSDIGKTLLLLAFALALDAAALWIRFRRPVCAVSAAVTALLLHLFSPGAPLWLEFCALAAALLIGKHVWGGTGKNFLNPAAFGMLFTALFYTVKFPVFLPSSLLIPAVLLSLPFLLFRPFAGFGMGIGICAALLIRHDLSAASLMGIGAVLWASLVITDPVTTTKKPVEGAVLGLLAGFVPILVGGGSVWSMALGILCANLLSFAADRAGMIPVSLHIKLKPARLSFSAQTVSFRDLTDEDQGADAPAADWKANADCVALSAGEILKRIEEAGVFGFGGAAFPTARKIRAAADSEAVQKHLIVNGVECDPGLVHDKWLLRERLNDIYTGIELLYRCILFSSVTLAVKDVHGISAMTEKSAYSATLRLFKIPDYYPAGEEKALIRRVLGRTLKENAIPAQEGILVLNVQTVLSIYEAVCLGRKADTRYLTLGDMNSRSASVLRVRLKSGVHQNIENAGSRQVNVYTGGGLMNAKRCAEGALVEEEVNFLGYGPTAGFREALCSRCGLCATACPAQLDVREIARLVDDGKTDRAAALHPDRCLQCGSCAYVCLAGRNLSERTRKAKEVCRARQNP